MKRKAFGSVLMGLGAVLIAAAIGLTGYNLWTQQQADEAAQAALEVLVQQIPTKPTVQEDTGSDAGNSAAGDYDDTMDAPAQVIPISRPDRVEYPDYVLNPDMDMPEVEIDGVKYIGYLEIPELELSLPVITETTTANLKIAPCRFAGSAYLKDLVIGAHNYTRHFGRLKELSYGDIIVFTDMDGNVFTYEVAGIEILQPDQAEELCSGEWPLTLYTCTVGGQTRVTVRCDLISEG